MGSPVVPLPRAETVTITFITSAEVTGRFLLIMRTSENIIALAKEIEEYFEENSCPIPNEPALRRIKFLCARIGGYDHYIAEKAGEIEYLAGRFFSSRKHKTHPGGADGIYSRIVHDLLSRIRDRAANIEYAERNP